MDEPSELSPSSQDSWNRFPILISDKKEVCKTTELSLWPMCCQAIVKKKSAAEP